MLTGNIILTFLAHKQTIAVLNTYASITSSKHKVGTAKFHTLFAGFIKAFEEGGEGYDVGYLDGHPNEAERAYWAFLNCLSDEVSSVEPAGADE
jgi:hypothetical protein